METVDPRHEPSPVQDTRWPVYALVLGLAIATIVTAGYLYHEKQQNQELASRNQVLDASLMELRSELQSVKNDLSTKTDLNTIPPPATVRTAALIEKPVQPVKARPAKAARAKAPSPKAQPPRDDPRFNQLQGQLSDQQKLLATTRDDLDRTREDLGRTRDDLQTNLNSTRGELSGSIARTHDELVALQKRGERNYYEFQLTKSKAFERVGPLRLSLRKADTKHKRFDMNLMVDDNELQKKSVNLYETVWLNLSDRPQPLELVINQITKDHISGYLSEPKYKRSELGQAAANGTPADAKAAQ